jgi:transcriptional regulator with XRE-family HTH domain
LGWGQAELARRSGVAEVTLKNIERGSSDPRASTLDNIQKAFDEVGVMFLDVGDTRGDGEGVRFKTRGQR